MNMRIVWFSRKKLIVFCTLFVVFLHVSVFFFSARPVQDDYSLLADIASKGFFSCIADMWNFHGGNLSPLTLNYLALFSAVKTVNFISLSVFSLVTFSLVSIIAFCFLRNFEFRKLPDSSHLVFVLTLGMIFGFEGLFTPGLIGAYHFTSASVVHLWPIVLAVAGFALMSAKKNFYILLLVLGFISGNSNIAESIAILFTFFLALLFPRLFNYAVPRKRLSVFLVGAFLGTLAIIASPGFWYRATEKTNDGLPLNFIEFITRFLRAFFVFSIEILTHPILYVFIITGIICAKKIIELRDSQLKFSFIEVLFVSLFSSLVFGATFAYPAWHQSIGILYLLPLFSFYIGVRLSQLFGKASYSFLKKLRFVFIVIVVISIFRAEAVIWGSGTDWHRSNQENICAIRANSDAEISNPEIVYPPFSLGIEDVQSWDWIRNAYIRWILEIPTGVGCE